MIGSASRFWTPIWKSLMADQPEAQDLPIHDSIRLPLCALVPMAENPQDQDGATFGQLVESIRRMGVAETVLVSGPFPDLPACPTHGDAHGMYKIVGGHHKVDAARVAGSPEVPCMVLPPMTEDELHVEIVRMNVIKGSLNPWKFTRLFNRLAKKYDPSVLRAKMGITSERAWKSLYRDVRKTLTPELARKLDAVKNEVHNVESLALIIKRIFTEHGEQLKCRFLVFDYGGQTHLMLKMTARTAENVDRLCKEAVAEKADLNNLVNRLLEQHLPDEPNEPVDAVAADQGLEQQPVHAGEGVT